MVNPNIATISTSESLADKVYFLPVTPEFVRRIVKYEKPDGIYATFRGQTALDVRIKLKDKFEAQSARRSSCSRRPWPRSGVCAESSTATNQEEATTAAQAIGFPVIVRAAYALGGPGSGFAQDEAQLKALCAKAFATSPQMHVEDEWVEGD